MDTDSRLGFWSKLVRIMKGGRRGSSEELEQEIQGLVDEGEAKGYLTSHEGDMIEAVLELGETFAGQIMVPRTELATVSQDSSLEEIIQEVIESGHSRIPVHAEDPDHIVGVIHAKDLLPFCGMPPEQVDLESILRPPYFVPQSMPLNDLLAAFKRRKVHLAVVVDEYGGTAGVVTLEDVLEEIVGEIEDEYDQEEILYHENGDGSYLVDARMEMDALGQHLGLELPGQLPEGGFETLGGFVITLLGRVPAVGEEVTWGPLQMRVTKADQRRVLQINLTPKEDLPESPEA